MAGKSALDGTTALVLGGGSGIGLACAIALARDGAAVTIGSRSEERLTNGVERIRAAVPGVKAAWITCEATDDEQVRRAVEQAVAPDGGLDICVQCVGGSTITPLLLCTPDVFRADLERNLVSNFLAIRHACSTMARSGGGSFVAISSDAAKLSFPFVGPYCAAKGGLEQLVRVAADELGAMGVRVNAVRPGLTITERTAHLVDDEEGMRIFVEKKPLHRLGRPDDIAAAVRYLAGPESSWVTGQSFAIDGGNELRGAPWLEDAAKRKHGAEAVDASMRGLINELRP
jgi:NAD(P)-dependent dehydrogenase (short-subunit alcohol dehydrogenase family)